MTFDYILYHGNCPDGFCAAYIAKKYNPDAKLVPCFYGKEFFPREYTNRNVLVVDFSWKRYVVKSLKIEAKELLIIDHHQTAQEELKGLDYCIFDMSKSGAMLTWEYFNQDLYPTDRNGSTAPWYVSYVQDRDLWKWELPDSKVMNAYIMAIPQTIEDWDHSIHNMQPEDAREIGNGMRFQVDHYISNVVKDRIECRWFGYDCALVNAHYSNISDVCGFLVKELQYQVGIGFYLRSDNKWQFSLRSLGNLDVSTIARVYGGGGHANAAGFELSFDTGLDLLKQGILKL